jgi:hypothetical protein
MVLKNKDLNVVLESLLRFIRQHRHEPIPAIAWVLTPEGRLTQFSSRSNLPAAAAVRYLENGVSALVGEGKCKALGLLFQAETQGEGGVTCSIGGVFLEHRDGTAYRIEVADFINGSQPFPRDGLVVFPAAPKFFPRSRFAQAH